MEVDYFERPPIDMEDPVIHLIRDYGEDEETGEQHWFARWEESE